MITKWPDWILEKLTFLEKHERRNEREAMLRGDDRARQRCIKLKKQLRVWIAEVKQHLQDKQDQMATARKARGARRGKSGSGETRIENKTAVAECET